MKGDYFGERGLLTGDARSASVVCLEDTTVLQLRAGEFTRVLGNFKQILEQRIKLQDVKVNLSDLETKSSLAA